MKQKILSSTAKKFIRLQIVLVPFLALFIYGCSTNVGSRAVAKYNENPLTVVVPAGLSANIVETAMATTLMGRRWAIQSRSHGTVVANLKHRGYDATVTLQSDGSIIKILNESTFLRSGADAPVPAVPGAWLVNIQRDLGGKLQSVQHSTGG